MPRGIDLHIPFPSRISPDAVRARSAHLHWPRGFGLLNTAEAADRHVRADYVGLAARFHPTVSGDDLDLGVDQMSWYFLFDDMFDGPLGEDPLQAQELAAAVAHTLDHPPTPLAAPIIRAFADLWRRSRDGMSPVWTARAAYHWRSYFAGYVTEARNRRHAIHPTASEHLRLRRDTIGVQPTLDLAERLGHYEIPQRVFTTPQLTAMRHVAAEVDAIHNDICSVEKEEAQGDPHNLVLIIQRDQGVSRADAVATMCRMLAARTERFLALEAELLGLGDRLRLTPAERLAVDRYAVDALRTVMRGDYDWAEGSGRYDVPDRPPLPEGVPP